MGSRPIQITGADDISGYHVKNWGVECGDATRGVMILVQGMHGSGALGGELGWGIDKDDFEKISEVTLPWRHPGSN